MSLQEKAKKTAFKFIDDSFGFRSGLQYQVRQQHDSDIIIHTETNMLHIANSVLKDAAAESPTRRAYIYDTFNNQLIAQAVHYDN